MCRGETDSLVETVRVNACLIRSELDQLATPAARLNDGPLHQVRPERTTPLAAGYPDTLDLSPESPFPRQAGQQ